MTLLPSNTSKLHPPKRPSPAYVERLLAAAEAMHAELGNLRQQADARQYHLEQVDREVALAARLQRDFLPRKLPEVGSLRFHVVHQPAAGVSGDMFAIDRLDEHHLGLHQIDAVGHGMPAALLAMFLHHAVRPKQVDADAYRLLAAGEVLAGMNVSLCGQGLTSGFFATAVYAKFNAEHGCVEFARGGHPMALHISGDDVLTVGGDGALLGIIPDEVFTVEHVQLARGDRLIFCTDGAEAIFADEGAGDPDIWRDAIAERRGLSATDLAADIRRAIGSKPDDDVTVIIVERV